MRIDPEIAERHWEAAAVEQVAERLRSEGYSVKRDGRFSGLRADLVARRGDETIVYEFKSPSEGGEDWARQVTRLREKAVERGARFHLVFVRPPRGHHAEVEGLDLALLSALRTQCPEELNRLPASTTIDDVSDVEIASIEVRRDEVITGGQATVTVALNTDDQARDVEYFPFTFEVVLDREGGVKDIIDLQVDTSAWLSEAAEVETST